MSRSIAKNKRQRRRRPTPHVALPPITNEDQVLTFAEWVALNKIGERTGRKIISSGNGPVITALTERRIGITVRNNRKWQQSCERA